MDGPPGTGKSQTIVNIVSELLSQGKKILFVSQKQAALEVVKKRLGNCSLGSFCLDLHNHQTKNKDFIDRLDNSFNHLRNQEMSQLEEKHINHFEALEINKKQLNSYAKKIQEKSGKLDKTIFEIYAINSQLESIEDALFYIENITSYDELKLSNVKKLITSLDSLKCVYQGIDNHPWKHLTRLDFIGLQEKESFNSKITKLLDKFKEFDDLTKKLYKQTGYEAIQSSVGEFHKGLKSFLLLSEKSKIVETWFESGNYTDLIFEASNDQEEHIELDKLKKDIESFTSVESLRERDIEEAIHQVSKYQGSVLGALLFFFSPTKKLLIGNFYKPDRPLPRLELIKEELQIFKNFLEADNKIKNKVRSLRSTYQEQYLGLETDWEQIINSLKWLNTLSQSHLGINSCVKEIILDSFQANEFEKLLNKVRNVEAEISKLLDKEIINFAALDGWYDLPLDELICLLNEKLNSFNMLDEWIKLCQVKEGLQNEGIQNFIEIVKDMNSNNDLEKLFEKRFYRLYLDEIERATPLLSSFHGADYEKTIEDFKMLDQDHFKLNQERVVSKIKNILNQQYSSSKNIPQIQERNATI